MPARGEGMQSEATNPLTTERRGSLKKLPGQESSVLLGFPTLMGWRKAGLNEMVGARVAGVERARIVQWARIVSERK